ncbi:hypothetical protein PR048_002592 [Dryococelus australis]|uniref:Uncharacterized protein n=1 Tax=Dryococelus australis TaxID=614101 RepID=A0ABQ9ILN1_9NEOP|nr:hypothetical protein PR048_002592 [Dryococelus australis]
MPPLKPYLVTLSSFPVKTASTKVCQIPFGYHLGVPSSIPGEVAPGFSYVGIVPDNAAGRRVFSELSSFRRSFTPTMLHTSLNPHRLSKTSMTSLRGNVENWETSASDSPLCPALAATTAHIPSTKRRIAGECARDREIERKRGRKRGREREKEIGRERMRAGEREREREEMVHVSGGDAGTQGGAISSLAESCGCNIRARARGDKAMRKQEAPLLSRHAFPGGNPHDILYIHLSRHFYTPFTVTSYFYKDLLPGKSSASCKQYLTNGRTARLPSTRTELDSRRGRPRIFARGNRAPEDATGRRVSRSLAPPCQHYAIRRFILIGSQDLDVKEPPNISTHSPANGATTSDDTANSLQQLAAFSFRLLPPIFLSHKSRLTKYYY